MLVAGARCPGQRLDQELLKGFSSHIFCLNLELTPLAFFSHPAGPPAASASVEEVTHFIMLTVQRQL